MRKGTTIRLRITLLTKPAPGGEVLPRYGEGAVRGEKKHRQLRKKEKQFSLYIY